jgi:hypothetical protein
VYQWFVFIHLVGFVVFLMAHGVSAFIAFHIRTLRDPALIKDHLALSQLASRVTYVGLLILLLGGAAAATMNDLWLKPWVLGSIAVLIAALIAMFVLAAGYYYRLRDLIAGKDGQPPLDDEALIAYLDSRRPEAIAAVGLVGLVALVWLMIFKPG